MSNHVLVLKRTSQDWYPSIDGTDRESYVRVSFFYPNEYEDKYCVAVGGEDDYGAGAWFDDEKEAWNRFLLIVCQEDVTMDYVISVGLNGW